MRESHRKRLGSAVLAALSLAATNSALAVDVPIVGTKLVVVDRAAAGGRAKAMFVAKDPSVTKGAGTDAGQIEATLDIAYDTVSGRFVMPQGTNWVVNRSGIAKYVNKTAPHGGAVKVGLVKPGSLLKVVGNSVGDAPLDITSAPTGPVYVAETVVNGAETARLCTQFTGCKYKTFKGDAGHKLTCKGNSTGDAACTAVSVCDCGDGVCQADENLLLCPEDCRISHAVTFPVAIGDCELAAFAASGDCSDLPSLSSLTDDLCFMGPTAEDITALLAAQCGGGGQSLSLAVGSSIPLGSGSTSSGLFAMKTCLDAGFQDFIAPIVPCGSGCVSPVTVLGFTPIHLVSVQVTGTPKGFTLSASCSPNGPCGLGICTGEAGDCSTCPEDCGGCTSACP